MDKSHEVILITGASSGFGRDTTLTLARLGHTVYASMRDTAGRNARASRELLDIGVSEGLALHVVELDVTNTSSVDRAVATVLDQAGRLDVLVNNAGIASAGVSEAFTDEQLAALLDINVIGIQRTLRAALPAMRAQRSGLVINIGSVLGRVTFPFFGLYGASKFAVEALTDSYRYELSQTGVEVVLVQPSAYPTGMYASIQQPGDARRGVAYGATGEIPAAMFAHFQATFAAADAPDPHDVAEAVASIIAGAKGKRPKRVVVGQPFGCDVINAAVAPVQEEVLRDLGLGALTDTAGQKTALQP